MISNKCIQIILSPAVRKSSPNGTNLRTQQHSHVWAFTSDCILWFSHVRCWRAPAVTLQKNFSAWRIATPRWGELWCPLRLCFYTNEMVIIQWLRAFYFSALLSTSSADRHTGDENWVGSWLQQKMRLVKDSKNVFSRRKECCPPERAPSAGLCWGLMHFFWSNTDAPKEHKMCRWWKYEQTCHYHCVLCFFLSQSSELFSSICLRFQIDLKYSNVSNICCTYRRDYVVFVCINFGLLWHSSPTEAPKGIPW